MNKLKELPHNFQLKYTSECACCSIIKNETITYSLQVDFIGGTNLNGEYHKKYRVYYAPKFYSNFKISPKTIGDNTGMGVSSIDKLASNLLSDIAELLKQQ